MIPRIVASLAALGLTTTLAAQAPTESIDIAANAKIRAEGFITSPGVGGVSGVS